MTPMHSKAVRALVMTGYGLNCEAETSHALGMAGAAVDMVHVNDVLDGRRKLDDFQILALIGGFSFGDHIGAGTVFATKLKYRMEDSLRDFVSKGRLVLGICNGFQTLVKLGLLPGFDRRSSKRLVALGWNDSGVFRDAWVRLAVNRKSPCIYTKGIESLYLPVRHGEGKFLAESDSVLEKLESMDLDVLRYVDPRTGKPTSEFPHNPNGSVKAIAGICDPSGRIFGLMPHPEAHLSPYNHPQWARNRIRGPLPAEGEGAALFRNAVEFAARNLL